MTYSCRHYKIKKKFCIFSSSEACCILATWFAYICQQLDFQSSQQQPGLHSGRCWLWCLDGEQQRDHLVQKTLVPKDKFQRILGFQVQINSRNVSFYKCIKHVFSFSIKFKKRSPFSSEGFQLTLQSRVLAFKPISHFSAVSFTDYWFL